jgi:hypothetical protein
MDKTTEQLMGAAFEAKARYAIGEIGRDAAKEAIQPYLDGVNVAAKRIIKKYPMAKFKPVTFMGFIR